MTQKLRVNITRMPRAHPPPLDVLAHTEGNRHVRCAAILEALAPIEVHNEVLI